MVFSVHMRVLGTQCVMDNEDYCPIIILIVPGLLTTLRLTFQSDAELGLVSDEITSQENLGEKYS